MLKDSSHRIKVICFAHLAEVSGAGTSLLATAQHLDREKFEAVFVLPGEGALAERARAAGVRTVVLPNPQVSMASAGLGARVGLMMRRAGYVRAVAKLLRREAADIAYISSTASIWAGLGAWLARRKIVWHVHETIERPSRGTRLKLWLIEGLSDAILYASKSALSTFPAVRVKRRKVVRNFVDLEKFGRERHAEKDGGDKDGLLRWMGAHENVVLANAAIWRKGPDVVVEAAAMLQDRLDAAAAKEADGVGFVIVGDPPESEREFFEGVKRRAAELGLDEAVKFAGARCDFDRLLQQAAVFVSASRNEALPISIVEAMAAGVPVIATDVGDCQELLGDGGSGIVIGAEDARGLAKAIDDVLRDKSGARVRAEAAMSKVRQVYDPATVMEEIEGVLREVAGERGKQAS